MRSDLQSAPEPSFFRGTNRLALRAFATAILCAAAMLGVGASAAGAAPKAEPGYSLLTSFAATGASGPWFSATSPMAVDSQGNILVASSTARPEGFAIYAPDPVLGGTFLTFVEAEVQPMDLAIDRSSDDLYVRSGPTIRRYLAGAGVTPTYSEDPGFPAVTFNPEGQGTPEIGVDPNTGDLLAYEPKGIEIRRYNAAGAQLGSFKLPSRIEQMTTSPDGGVWVKPVGVAQLQHFSAAGGLMQSIALPSENVGPLTVDPASGSVIVPMLGASSYFARYSAAGVLQSKSSFTGAVTGLEVDPSSGLLYAYTGSTYNAGEFGVYVPAVYPGVEAPQVSEVQPTSFHLRTEVDPGDDDPGPAVHVPEGSVMHFEYQRVGAGSWTSTSSQPVAAPGTFEADVSGLEPNRAYLVRAVAANAQSEHVTEPIEVRTVSVAPDVGTNEATDLTETSAVLNGSINTRGLQTTYHFEYGLTDSYGSRVPVSIDAVAGTDYAVKTFRRAISELAPGTTYHFRLVATNASGTTAGPDRTFTTVSPGGIPVRGYEQVTPADKHGLIISTSNWGAQVKGDGNGYVYVARSAEKGSPLNSMWVSMRGSDDWDGGTPLDPTFSSPGGSVVPFTTLAVSDDFTHSLIATNQPLLPGGREGRAVVNLYVQDIKTGRYEAVGSSEDGFRNFTGIEESWHFEAAAPDMSWIVFSSTAKLLPGHPVGGSFENNTLYRWSKADGLEFASVLPDGDVSNVRSAGTSVFRNLGVSTDGSRIFFSAVGGSEEGIFVREGDVTKPVSHSMAEPTVAVPAALIGMSDDARYLYMSSVKPGEPLTADAPGGAGDLYRYDASDGSVQYLGARALTEETSSTGVTITTGPFPATDDSIYFNASTDGSNAGATGFSVWRDGVVHHLSPDTYTSASVYPSPDGRYVTFLANGGLDVYDSKTDQLRCASCLPDGTPVGAGTPFTNIGISNQHTLNVDDSGTVYFDTGARLLAADINGKEDVYYYRGGRLGLISPGDGPYDASFMGISKEGSNVFFATSEKLVGRDNDGSTDIYDARIGGGLAAQSPSAAQECLRDDCKATPNAGPELPFGGSEALSGPGNVTPVKAARCGKGKRAVKKKGKHRCVRQKKTKKKSDKKQPRRKKGTTGGRRR